MKNLLNSTIIALFIIASNALFSSPEEDLSIHEKITATMEQLELHKECHVNIFRLSMALKERLSPDEFDQVSVLVLRPTGYHYLPNSVWYHHVALMFNDWVFDFFHYDESKKFTGQLLDDYLNSMYFDHRQAYINETLSQVIDVNKEDEYRGFSSFSLIGDKLNRKMTLTMLKADDYIPCIDKCTISFAQIEGTESYKKRVVSMEEHNYLLWYKRTFNGAIREVDAFYLWHMLHTFLTKAFLKDTTQNAKLLCESMISEFSWPQLDQLRKDWKESVLTTKIYFQMLKNKFPRPTP